MGRLKQQRRARARRAARQYMREADGDREDIGWPGPGIVRRMVTKILNRRDRADGGPF